MTVAILLAGPVFAADGHDDIRSGSSYRAGSYTVTVHYGNVTQPNDPDHNLKADSHWGSDTGYNDPYSDWCSHDC